MYHPLLWNYAIGGVTLNGISNTDLWTSQCMYTYTSLYIIVCLCIHLVCLSVIVGGCHRLATKLSNWCLCATAQNYCVGYIPSPPDEASRPQVKTETPSLTSPSLHAWLILDVKGKCIFRNCTIIEVFGTRVGHPKMNTGRQALRQLHLMWKYVESFVFHWNQS